MKMVFAIPKNKSLFGDKGMTVHPHIGVAYLSAFLKEHNISVKIYDDGLDDDFNKLYNLITEFKPDLIGVTIFSYCYGLSYNLIKRIKESLSIPIVCGGPHVSAIGKKILDNKEIDFAIKQEGEFTLLDLLNELNKSNPDFASIRGLIWRNHEYSAIENAHRDLIIDLDTIPFPDYDSFDIKRYVCYKQKTLPLITSRGCPFSCNYCSVRLSMGQRFRVRSAENVISEIKYFFDRGFTNFDINDDCFTLDRQRAEKICELIVENKLNIRFQLYNGIRVDTVNPSLLMKMKQAGCYFISYGCEAGNDKMLKIIKKNITLEQVRDAVRWTNEAGIRNSVNFIIGHTQETFQDALNTINFAKSLPTDYVNFYNLLTYPGTEAYEWTMKNAHFLVDSESYLENISYRDNEPTFETNEFTKIQRKKIISIGFEIYRKTLLTFRLGKILGNIVYFITKNKMINNLATIFALNNRIGRFIYISLSKKSFIEKTNGKRLVRNT